MRCPHCGRNLKLWRLRCPTCGQRLALWYVVVVLLVLGEAALALLILEAI